MGKKLRHITSTIAKAKLRLISRFIKDLLFLSYLFYAIHLYCNIFDAKKQHYYINIFLFYNLIINTDCNRSPYLQILEF